EAEYDFRNAGHTLPCFHARQKIFQHACEIYRFRSLRGFFEAEVIGTDTMTPMQREFIRLAQIFKSQMLAEVELNQRVIERAIIEERSNTEQREAAALNPAQDRAFALYSQAVLATVESRKDFGEIERILADLEKIHDISRQFVDAQVELINLPKLNNTIRGED